MIQARARRIFFAILYRLRYRGGVATHIRSCERTPPVNWCASVQTSSAPFPSSVLPRPLLTPLLPHIHGEAAAVRREVRDSPLSLIAGGAACASCFLPSAPQTFSSRELRQERACNDNFSTNITARPCLVRIAGLRWSARAASHPLIFAD